MRFLKGLFTCAFWLLIIALMVAPLYLIFEISQAEMAKYQTPEAPVLREVSIGTVVQATRADVAEYITVSGSVTSTTYVYQELDYKYSGEIRWYVTTGGEIQEGQVLGTYRGEDIVAENTGIIDQMNTAYIRVRLFTPVEFQCRVDDRTLSILKRSDDMITSNGAAVSLIFASSMKNADGTTNVRLYIDSDQYTFGQVLSDLQIMTGRVFSRTIVLPASCVYQKVVGADEPWYVRQVTENGIFITETEVKIGYSNGDVVCVSGISEGTYYDSGYKAVAGG